MLFARTQKQKSKGKGKPSEKRKKEICMNIYWVKLTIKKKLDKLIEY